MVWATDNSCDHGAPLRLHTRHVPAGCALHCSRALTADPCARGQAARLLKPEARPEARRTMRFSECFFSGAVHHQFKFIYHLQITSAAGHPSGPAPDLAGLHAPSVETNYQIQQRLP